jgi:hypothetical protein
MRQRGVSRSAVTAKETAMAGTAVDGNREERCLLSRCLQGNLGRKRWCVRTREAVCVCRTRRERYLRRFPDVNLHRSPCGVELAHEHKGGEGLLSS